MKKDEMSTGIACERQTAMLGREQKQDIISGEHAVKSRNEMSDNI